MGRSDLNTFQCLLLELMTPFELNISLLCLREGSNNQIPAAYGGRKDSVASESAGKVLVYRASAALVSG